MIDFQNDGLEHQVYELISRMCDLTCSDEFPKFETKELPKKWECRLKIPGVVTSGVGYGNNEVEAINNCALNMLMILNTNHDKNQFDPNVPDSVFRNNIEQFFGDVDYDKRYRYYLCETDIRIDYQTEMELDRFAKDVVDKINSNSAYVDMMSDIVTIRYLVKTKRDHCC